MILEAAKKGAKSELFKFRERLLIRLKITSTKKRKVCKEHVFYTLKDLSIVLYISFFYLILL
jgi:hypothetical protein